MTWEIKQFWYLYFQECSKPETTLQNFDREMKAEEGKAEVKVYPI